MFAARGFGEHDWLVTYDGAKSAAEDETEETPENEAEGHGLFAADAVHEETADYAAGEVEAVYYGLSGEVRGMVSVDWGFLG